MEEGAVCKALQKYERADQIKAAENVIKLFHESRAALALIKIPFTFQRHSLYQIKNVLYGLVIKANQRWWEENEAWKRGNCWKMWRVKEAKDGK